MRRPIIGDTMGQRHALAAALLLAAACTAKKSSKVKATKPPNEYSTKNTTIAASPWRRKGAVFEEVGPSRFALFGGKVKDPRANNGRAAYAGDAWLLTVRRLTEGGAEWTPVHMSNLSRRASRHGSIMTSTPSTRRQLDGVPLGVSHRSIRSARSRF